jgi:Ca2+-binding EF-hand superfamily protein
MLFTKLNRPGLTEDEIEEIKEAFNLFDTEGTGRVDPRELKAAMQSLGFDSKNPTIFGMIAELEGEGYISIIIKFKKVMKLILTNFWMPLPQSLETVNLVMV